METLISGSNNSFHPFESPHRIP